MTAIKVLHNNYLYDESRSDTDEFYNAIEYVTKGLNAQRTEDIRELLSNAMEAETFLAFKAGFKAAVNIFTGGFGND